MKTKNNEQSATHVLGAASASMFFAVISISSIIRR
jgi:hypothetical protein